MGMSSPRQWVALWLLVESESIDTEGRTVASKRGQHQNYCINGNHCKDNSCGKFVHIPIQPIRHTGRIRRLICRRSSDASTLGRRRHPMDLWHTKQEQDNSSSNWHLF